MYEDIVRVRHASGEGGEHFAEAVARSERWMKATFAPKTNVESGPATESRVSSPPKRKGRTKK
jgi:hypothetical protein